MQSNKTRRRRPNEILICHAVLFTPNTAPPPHLTHTYPTHTPPITLWVHSKQSSIWLSNIFSCGVQFGCIRCLHKWTRVDLIQKTNTYLFYFFYIVRLWKVDRSNFNMLKKIVESSFRLNWSRTAWCDTWHAHSTNCGQPKHTEKDHFKLFQQIWSLKKTNSKNKFCSRWKNVENFTTTLQKPSCFGLCSPITSIKYSFFCACLKCG